ncbi:MAG: endonuclease domain-containing protein [Allosphingosinicella sp.]|uniref:endonuclease domain-containing protein n=1 Tax=Allosphingosinicella sp. TaxID=2823234 RepID=UPI003951E3B7
MRSMVEGQMRQTSKATVAKARSLRRALSPPEARLWQYLRTRPEGLKFRRQHPAGPFILDFYCPAARLAIEVDGEAHDMGANPARDIRRDRWLTEHGILVLRIPAAELHTNLEGAVLHILEHCRERP